MRDSLLIGFLFLTSIAISFLQPSAASTLQGITINLLLLTIYTLSKHNLYESKNENQYIKRLNYGLSYLLLTISILSYGITRIVLFVLTYKSKFINMNYFEKSYFITESIFLLIFVWLLFKLIFEEVFDINLKRKTNRKKEFKQKKEEKEVIEESDKEISEEMEKKIEEEINMIVRKSREQGIEKLPVIVYVD